MAEQDGAATTQRRGRVLVVDDARLVRAMVLRHLRAGGFAADEAADGSEALRVLAQGEYDVVITDLRMPEMDGFEVLAAVKRIRPSVEVIILTGTHASDTACAVRALRLGAHDYLTKPVSSPEEVLLTVEHAVEKKRLKDENMRLLNELQALSRTDGLTGAANRRSLDEAIARELARSRRYGHDLGVVILDIDHFKAVNDAHGHEGGDEVLRSFVRVAALTLREGDTFYRYGGEEFVALLPHTGIASAERVAARIVESVAGTPVRVRGIWVSITTSAGVACLVGDGPDLLARADAALYQAKAEGRNRVCISRPRLTLAVGGAWRRAEAHGRGAPRNAGRADNEVMDRRAEGGRR
jgi:two-component system, cell cycle response regulator